MFDNIVWKNIQKVILLFTMPMLVTLAFSWRAGIDVMYMTHPYIMSMLIACFISSSVMTLAVAAIVGAINTGQSERSNFFWKSAQKAIWLFTMSLSVMLAFYLGEEIDVSYMTHSQIMGALIACFFSSFTVTAIVAAIVELLDDGQSEPSTGKKKREWKDSASETYTEHLAIESEDSTEEIEVLRMANQDRAYLRYNNSGIMRYDR